MFLNLNRPSSRGVSGPECAAHSSAQLHAADSSVKNTANAPARFLATPHSSARFLAAALIVFSWQLAPATAALAQTDDGILSPAEYLGYELGEKFTFHHQVIGYVRHVAERSDRVTVSTYGTTYEGRDLVLAVVTSPENHGHLEEIRTNNLKLTGLLEGTPTDRRKAIAWLSYNVHGDEASSSEAVMMTLHELAVRSDAEVMEWLERTVILMDPMVNPDGRDRYASFFRQQVGAVANPNHEAQEHRQPWPGGRPNHYLFDLNRDWAWLTQKESQQRIEAYHEWMPHVHVDFHEQGYDAPYYFAPAAEPFHKAITDWQREFQQTIGSYNMEAFDREGWLYFTRERFDLFYPSYGDTWPTYNGSIGMTYEQAGHGFAGLTVTKPEGDELTLLDRLTHHHAAGMATIKATSDHAERVKAEFASHFSISRTQPAGTYGSYVIRGGQHPDKMAALAKYLDTQRIRYSRVEASRTLSAYDYRRGADRRIQIMPGDVLIPSAQPKSQLLRTLFEPRPELSDSLTYDITSWEMPYRFGLEAYAVKDRIAPGAWLTAADFEVGSGVATVEGGPAVRTGVEPGRAYAYLLEWGSLDDARFLADWLEEGGMARVSMNPFRIGSETFPRGTMVLTRAGNPDLGDRFDGLARELAERHSRSLHAVPSGAVSSGSDFGSETHVLLKAPRIAVISRDATSSLSFGEIWHFMDQQLEYPATMIPGMEFSPSMLESYDVLVLPAGFYRRWNASTWEGVVEWVRDGGTLVAVGYANRVLAGMDEFAIKVKEASGDGSKSGEAGGDGAEGDAGLPGVASRYENRERNSATDFNTGSIYRMTLDDSHPLAFGYQGETYVLNISDDAYTLMEDGWNVGRFGTDAHLSGFVGTKAQSRFDGSLGAGVEHMGSGKVVYLPVNPLFRGFWEESKLMFVNALFVPMP